MIAVRTQTSDYDDPMAGFDRCPTLLGKIYLLQVKTGSPTLDDVLYTLAHPTASDALPGGATHADVVVAIRHISTSQPAFADIAHQLATNYEQTYCD